MNVKLTTLALALASAVLLTMAGCGGGDGNSTGSSSAGGTSTPATLTLTGVAATGAALANADVTITNSNGTSPCQETTITTSALGSYTCTLKTGETAPFFIVVTDPTGNTAPLVSVATTTPAAGTPLTVNATPLTTAIVAQLAGGDALAVVNSKTVDATALQQVTANVLAQLGSVLSAIGAPTGYDPFTTSITAATASGTGNTADLLLDVVKVVTDPATGQLALATVDNPTPVILASASTSGATVAAPATAVTTLSQATQIAAQAFTACFALPTSQRVLSTDASVAASQGGPTVTSVATACQDIVASVDNAAGIDFLHNGYEGGQLLYGLLTSDTMTGAQFSVPEIMAFYPADGTASPPAAAAYDQAVLNIRYLDASGNPGNVVTVARSIPNTASSTRPTNWWLVGNQQPVDVTAKLNIRRVEQMNPASTDTNRMSTFQSGVQFSVNAKGPGSTNLQFARISGPGLPGNGAAGTGLVYVRSSGSQNAMDLYSKNGSLTTGSQCGNGVTFNCPNLWVTRTQDISGSGAATLAANPAGLVWAQTADGLDPSKLVKGARYKVELFYGADLATAQASTPVYFHKTLLSDLIPATQAVNLPWNTPGPQTLLALDPSGSLAGAQSALTVDWVQNPAAQQIGGAQSVVNTTTGSFGPTKAVPRGATSVVLDNQTVPAFGSPPRRTLLLSYRMLDTSNKTAVYQYN